jgi:glycosyltransferase involved in cell wall biosynthesis
MPDYRFVMVGGPVHGYERLFEDVQSAARTVNNLEVAGFVPYAKIGSYYSRSRLFVNTSDSEGFPNSFLQSWIRGTPVVSFFDPDNIISCNRLGAVPVSMDDMVDLLGRMLTDTGELSEASQRVRKFAEENYLPSAVASRYASMVDEL